MSPQRDGANARGPLIGAQVSIAGGVELAPERGVRLGCRAIQIFTRSSNQWRTKPLAAESARRFREEVARHALSVIAHDSYLINVGSGDPVLWRRSVDALTEELVRCEELRVPRLVMHPGAHKGAGETVGLELVARGVREALRRTRGCRVGILLENTAGMGTQLGHRFEHLAEILRALDSRRTGICLDTCHAHAAGYDLSGRGAFSRLVGELERLGLLDRLGAIHVNDSKREAGSRVDRHEELGRGRIGFEAFRELMADPRLEAIPKVIETPKGRDDANDRRALRLLRRYSRLQLPATSNQPETLARGGLWLAAGSWPLAARTRSRRS